jgi:hypothetical protein
MYTRYDYTTTAKITDVLMDTCKILGGETNKANLSSSCIQAATTITSTEPSGWEFVTCSNEGQIAGGGANSFYAESTTQGKFFRSNPGSNTVGVYSYLNTTMQVADATIATSTNPTWMAINNVTDRLYVMCTTAITVINTATNAIVATITMPLTTQGIAINTVTNKIYVGDSTGVNVIDGTNNTTAKTVLGVSVGSSSNKMVLNETTGFMYFTVTNTIRKYTLSNNTMATVYTASGTLTDMALDVPNNVYYAAGQYTEGLRIWGFDGATDTRQGTAFATIVTGLNKIETMTQAGTRILVSANTGAPIDIKVFDLDTKALIRTPFTSTAWYGTTKLTDSILVYNTSGVPYRIDCWQGNKPMTAKDTFYYFRALNADALTYKYIFLTFTGTTIPRVEAYSLEPYSTATRAITGQTSGTNTVNVSVTLGGSMFIGSSNRYAFISGWINGTFQNKIGITERTRDAAWDTSAYGVQPIVHLTPDSLGTTSAAHYAPRCKNLNGTDSLGDSYNTTSLLLNNSGSVSTMVQIPDATFVAKNPVLYVNFISATRGDLGGRALGLPITTANLGTNLDEIVYNGNNYVMFACGTSNNRIMVPKF